MAKREWNTTFDGANPVQDADPIGEQTTGVMPDLDDESAPGAGDGDDALSSQVEKLRDKLQTLAKLVGDSLSAPVGSLADILERDHANGDALSVRLRERGTDPTAVGDKAFLYAKDDGGTTKVYVRWSDGTVVELGSGGGAAAFVDLTDTPANFTGSAGKKLRVNSTPDAVEFVDDTLLNLSDTPASLSGDATKLLAVNGAETGYEHVGRGNFAPSAYIEAIGHAPSTTFSNSTNTTWLKIDDPASPSEFEGEFVAPYAGWYRFVWSCSFYLNPINTGDHMRWRLVFDEGAGNQQIVGGDTAWEQAGPPGATVGDRATKSFAFYVYLEAGTHTVVPEWYKMNVGTGVLVVDADTGYAYLEGTLVTGTTAGGNVISAGLKTSEQTVPYTVTPTSGVTPTVLTELTLDFDAVEHEDVEICFDIPTDTGSATVHTRGLSYRINGGVWTCIDVRAGAFAYTFTGSIKLEDLSSGSYTVEFGAFCDMVDCDVLGGGTQLWGTSGIAPVAATWAVQDRGGRVAVYDSTDLANPVADKFEAMVFDGAGVAEVVSNDGGKTVEVHLASHVAGPGERIVAIDSVAPSNLTATGAWADVPGASGSFEATVNGTYGIEVLIRNVSIETAGTLKYAGVRFRLVFDNDTVDGVVGTDDFKWHSYVNVQAQNQRMDFVQSAEFDLGAGSHDVKLQFYKFDGDANAIYQNAMSSVKVVLAPIVGSTVNGDLIDRRTMDQDWTYDNGAGLGTWQNVQDSGGDVAVVVETYEGEVLRFGGNVTLGEGVGDTSILVGIGIDGADPVTAHIAMASDDRGETGHTTSLPTHSLPQDAGTHTYRLMVKAINAAIVVVLGGSTFADAVSTFVVERPRGATFPCYDDGVLVEDKPASLDTGLNVKATSVGGKVILSAPGITAGLDAPTPERKMSGAFAVTGPTATDVLVAPAGNPVEETFEVVEGENVVVNCPFACYNDANASYVDFYLVLDGSTTVAFRREYFAASSYKSLSLAATIRGLSAGPHTVKARVAINAAMTLTFYHSIGNIGEIEVGRFRGGYVEPENVPVLEYLNAGSVRAVARKGASSVATVLLSDGLRYTAALPLTASMATDLESGSETASTHYYAYLVPDSANPGEAKLVISPNDPATGPANHAVSRYLGPIRNDASSDFLPFHFNGDRCEYLQRYEPAASVALGTSEVAKSNLSLADYVPPTADLVSVGMYIQHSGGVSGYSAWNYLYVKGEGTRLLETLAVDAFDPMLIYGEVPIPDLSASVDYESGDDNPGTIIFDQTVWVLGYRDAYLGGRQAAQLQAKYEPDSSQPKGTWGSATTVDFAARPGQPALVRRTLSDGKSRTFSGTLNWDSANGVADLGFDEAASQTGDAWIYFYLVPDTGNDDLLTVVASDNPPSTGPTGRSIFECVWVDYRSSGSLIEVYQNGNRFNYATNSAIFGFTGAGSGDGSVQTASLATHVPVTAAAARLNGYVQFVAADTMFVFVTGKGSTSSPHNLAQLKSATPTAGAGQWNEGQVPTPGGTKQVEYYRPTNYNESRLECLGWVDEWIDA